MTDQNDAASQPTAEPEQQTAWFGASNRPAGTEPDTRYGWLTWGQGVYIVKAINQTHTHYGPTLLGYERRALSELNRFKAPVPALWDDATHPLPNGWLATQFGGLSLQRLSQPGTPDQHAGLPPLEQWACWVHFLERAQGMAVAGIIPIDLWAGNLVVPFTEDASGQAKLSGQLKLNGVINIDHAHTVAAGWNMRRPVWIGHEMGRVPPELRPLLKADQLALLQHFANQGLPLTSGGVPSHADPERVARSRALWLAYDQPQSLQKRVDAGLVNAHHVIQYAVGTDLSTQRLSGLPPALQKALKPVLARMTAKTPQQRYATLQDAATALRAVLPSVPLVGAVHYPTVSPNTLRLKPAQPPAQPSLKEQVLGVLRRQAPQRPAQPQPTAPMSERDWKLIYLALALGAALGAIFLG